MTRHQITRRLHNERLHELHQGVYLVGHAVPPALAPEQAALLATRSREVLSHRTAANLWDLLPYPASAPVHVTVPPERRATRPGLRVHAARIPPGDVRRRHGLPTTSPPRTVLDFAADLDPGDLEQLVAEASFRRLATEAELCEQLQRNRGKRGAAQLRRVIAAGPKFTRSGGERRLLRLLRAAGLAGFETNARIHGYEVDFLWRDAGLVVELDGYDAHSGRTAFERDRAKWAALTAHGLTVMPLSARQLRSDPAGTVSRISAAAR